MRIGFWHWRSTSGYKISTQWFLSNEHWILTAWWRVAAGCEPPRAHLCSQLSWHGICTLVLNWHLYSCAWLAFVLLYSTWLYVLVYSTENCSHVLKWHIICTRSKSRRSFWFVPRGQNFPAWQNKLWSVGLIAHNQIDEYIGAHYSAFIRILAAFYEAVHYSELHWFAMLSDSMAGKTNMPLMGTAGHLLYHQQHHQIDICLKSKTEYLYIIQNCWAPPLSEQSEQVRF